jgi:hypothetical protein
MRTDNGKLIINLGDSVSEVVSGSFTALDKSTVNENQTEYTLYPLELNDVPIITKNIYDASTPQILREEIALSIPDNQKNMFLSQDGTVKVAVGAGFTLSIEAQQPQVLNVENGVPIIKEKDAELIYIWSKDGNTIPNGTTYILEGGGNDADFEYATAYIKAEGRNLIFFNTTANAAGNYSCEIRNDIGSVQSEPISIAVNDPLSTFDAFFNKNLVQNPFGMDGDSGWTSIQGSIQTKEFVNIDTLGESTDTLLKKPDQRIVGYTPNQFYPLPSNIRVLNIKNYELHNIANGQSRFFSRERLKSIYDNGIRTVAVYQDIDLADITDYVQGKVFGVDAIRLFFGAYIGNLLNRSFPQKELVPQSRRYLRDFYYYGAPRISIENFLWAGYMTKTETVKVILQELDGDVLLASKVIESDGVKLKQGIELKDPVTKAVDRAWAEDKVSVYPIDSYKIGYTLKPRDPENVILRAYQLLHGTRNNTTEFFVGPTIPNSRDLYYNSGQYVEYNSVYLESLNKRTNKVRINLVFDINDDRLYEYFDPSPNNLLDVVTWDQPTTRGRFWSQTRPPDSRPYYSIANNAGENRVDDPKQPNKPAEKVYLSGAESAPMVTGLGLSLHPVMTKTKSLIGDTPQKFTRSIVFIPDPTDDLLNRPIINSPLTLGSRFIPTGTAFERWRFAFYYTKKNRPSASDKGDPSPDSFRFEIHIQKYNEESKKWEQQNKFPTISRNAKCLIGQDIGIGQSIFDAAQTAQSIINFDTLAKKVGAPSGNNLIGNLFQNLINVPGGEERGVRFEYVNKMDANDLRSICQSPAPQNWNFNVTFRGDDYGYLERDANEAYASKLYKIKQGDPAPYINNFNNSELLGKGRDGYENINSARGGSRVNLELENDNSRKRQEGFEDEINLMRIFQNPADEKNGQPPAAIIYDEGLTMLFTYRVEAFYNN